MTPSLFKSPSGLAVVALVAIAISSTGWAGSLAPQSDRLDAGRLDANQGRWKDDTYKGSKGSPAFEIKDFNFGSENRTTIGSATGGAGAGKVKFNEFGVTKTIDSSSKKPVKCRGGAC
jgi:hypothetical protein